MSYFLRHFAGHAADRPSTSAESLSNTLLDFSMESDGSYLRRQHERTVIRECYSEILLRAAKATYKNTLLGSSNSAERHFKDVPDHASTETVLDNIKYTEVIAPPSLFGANMLALTTTLRTLAVQQPNQTILHANGLQPTSGSPTRFVTTAAASQFVTAQPTTTPSAFPTQSLGRGNRLVTVGLDSVFSVLLELNKRDPELCAQALQQLLQLLQAIPPEGMVGESRTVVSKMHELLKSLRAEGNSSVSSCANACLVSLAVARGEPEMLFSAVRCLLCDQKSNVPFNQLQSECNPLPRNFQLFARGVQKLVHASDCSLPEACGFFSIPIDEHAEFASFDVSFPGNFSSSDLSEVQPRTRSCLASDGSYVYVLSLYGLFKMGTGLTETQAGKVIVFNEMLKFIDGSALFVCQDSLYMRRKHSTRLWVIDKETLREIGEIMLQASLTEGVLFSDGRNFYQGTLDDQWNFMITPLDDSFGALHSQKHKQSNRLVEFNYVVLGESLSGSREKLVEAVPPNLQMIAVDVQFSEDTAFLLTRSGKVFYAGRGSAFSLPDMGTSWAELVVPEPMVQMHFDTLANCLLLRSGACHLWSMGSLTGLIENQLPQGHHHNKRFRKLRIPHRRKCSALIGVSSVMAYVTDNGKCFLFGRHIVSCNSESGQMMGFDGFSIATLGIGKTHLVAISKSGLVYTSGLNNLNQCGRDEVPVVPQTKLPSAPFANNSPAVSPNGAYCFPNEHLFIKDAASICLRCGKCSGRNDKCPTQVAPGGLRKVYLQRGMMCVCDSLESACLRCGICQTCADSVNLRRHPEDEEAPREVSKTQGGSLSPARLVLQGDIKVSTVSCGNYHTILLCADRSVYTFGSNCHGQLGTGDTLKRSGAYKLNLPSNIQVVQAVAGANHCILRTLDGQILTFGAHKNGQLGRKAPQNTASGSKWFAEPTIVEGFGQATGTIVSWVSTAGDRTILQTQKQTFSKTVLSDSVVTANRDCLVVVPPRSDVVEDYVIVRRMTGEVNQFKLNEQRLATVSFALDPHYDLLWTFDHDAFKVVAYSEGRHLEELPPNGPANVESLASTLTEVDLCNEPEVVRRHRQLLRCPELCVPNEGDPEFSDTQLAIFMLTTVYSMSVLSATGQVPDPSHPLAETSRRASRRLKANLFRTEHDLGGYCALNRFESFGGGWGYSAHCVEAIQFKVSKAIQLCGVGLFGGRGEYAAKVKLLRVVGAGEMDEQCVELLTESDEIIYECAARETAVLQFTKAVVVREDEWHVLWAQVQGPSSDCGASGQAVIQGPGEVEFSFRNSILSNNGTDVKVGQIPEVYYLVHEPGATDSDATSKDVGDKLPSPTMDQLPLISPTTLFSITPSTIANLFVIFDWATRHTFVEQEDSTHLEEETLWRQERAAFVAIVTLRMIRLYITLLFANEGVGESDDGVERTLSTPQLDDFANLIIEFAAILRNIFATADERFFASDRVTALVVDEAVDAYVSCSELLLPAPAIVRNRLAQAIARDQRNWALLALLRACLRLERSALAVLMPEPGHVLPVSGKAEHRSVAQLSDRLSKYFSPTKNGSGGELTGVGLVTFLFDLGFGTKEGEQEDVLFGLLKKAAQNLLVLYAKTLVANSLQGDAGPPLQATENRFRRFNSHLNWETGNGAHDAIAFKTESAGVTVHGVGIFIGAAAVGEFTFELETFVNTGDIANECWSLLEQQTGSVKDASLSNFPHLQSAPQQRLVTGIKLQKPIVMKPDTTYAIRIHLSAGKTFYGESGQATVKLSNGARLNFLPCGLSRNGTSIMRGQLPYLIYAVNEPKRSARAPPTHDGDFWSVGDEGHDIFLELMRLLAHKLSLLSALDGLRAPEKAVAAQLIAYGNVFLEANPHLAFSLISAVDEVVPLISAGNVDELKHTTAESGALGRPMATAPSTTGESGLIVQAIVESPHPYRSGSVFSQTLTFDQNVEFMALRFHDECQTAQPDDCLWVFVGHADSGCFFPVGRYSGQKRWPDGQLLLPGNRLWFVLETVVPGEELDPNQMHGFRCTVDGYCSRATSEGGPSNALLEQQFVWLLSSACRLLVQAPVKPRGPRVLQEQEETTHELIRKHGSLLKKGLLVDEVPGIKDVLFDRLSEPAPSQERLFLDEFITASPDSPAGRLARAFSTDQPFVDLSLSTIEIEAVEIVVGKTVRLVLVQKDQQNRDARCTNLTIELTIASADDVVTQEITEQDFKNQNSPQPESSNSGSLTVTDDQQNWRVGQVLGKDNFQTLRQMQIEERFMPTYLNKARYNTLTLMPAFANFSLEELRLAFQQSVCAKERLELQFNAHTGFFATDWRPVRPGRFRIDCTVDGFRLASTTFIEVAERRSPCPSPRIPFDLRPHPHDHLQRPKMARLDPLSNFMAVRVRTYPSLSAPSIGSVERGCTLTWLEAVKNEEGTWLKLSEEAKALFCDQRPSPPGAWCLQFHAAFDTKLLVVDDAAEEQQIAVDPAPAEPAPRGSRKLPPLPSRSTKPWHTELTEDADVLTVKRASPQSSTTSMQHEALSPRLMDTCRSVFAAVVWHERLSDELMTCANHLKDTPRLENLFSDLQSPILPPCFLPLIRLYRCTVQSVLEIVEQHLILPSPPSIRELTARQLFPPAEEVCELCRQLHPKPITAHMREKHPGCRGPCGGNGYNSIGSYTTGWTGLCGDGGRSNAVWYLLCPSCRNAYLARTAEKTAREAKPAPADPNDWNTFRQRATSRQTSAENILRQNALFLLELRPCEDSARLPVRVGGKKGLQGVRVNLYPQTGTLGQLESGQLGVGEPHLIDTDLASPHASPLHNTSHQSDPGAVPELLACGDEPFSLSASANLFRQSPKSPTDRRPQRLASLNGLNELLRHPVLLFCIEAHDLAVVRDAFRRSISRATRFAYAFRVWNWLLKLVTAEGIVTDIVWNYLEALWSYTPFHHDTHVDLRFATKLRLLPHPWRLCFLAGPEISGVMIEEMHAFLGTLAVILQSGDVDMPLKCLCFKAWTFQLTVHEQSLLLTMCNILSAVGAVLADASGDSSFFDEGTLSILAALVPPTQTTPSSVPKKPVRRLSSSQFHISPQAVIRQHENVSSRLNILPSSRSQLVGCLVDGNLDTFWESGDEDKGRTRKLTLGWDEEAVRIEMVALFVDNIRDSGFKVNHITVRTNKSTVFNAQIDWSFVGWVKVLVAATNELQIQLKGCEAGCRVRQVVAFGFLTDPADERGVQERGTLKPSSSNQLLFSTAQMDAFMLFQAIAAQAFSNELSEEQNGTLRQQVIDMLFSRVQLQPLQSYVCFQMVSAVEREIANLRDRTKRNYSYVCGLMVMLVKICASRRGLEVFSLRNGLLIVLSELLLFAPQIVQLQTIETMSALLRHFRPTALDCAQFLQNILATVAKSVRLQVKDRVTRKVTTQKLESLTSELPPHWKVERPVTSEVAQLLVKFIGQITGAEFTDVWAVAVKTELANVVMNLAQLVTLARSSSTNLTETALAETATRTAQALRGSQFWLAVAALAVIQEASWLEYAPAWRALRARRSQEPDPVCENHDDGVTLAQLRCEICDVNLCRECFAVLHLSKKKKSHNARFIGSSTLCPKVDVHEGCTRLRLNNLLILFNANKLSGMVEICTDFGAGPGTSSGIVVPSSSFANLASLHASGKCRFCAHALKTEAETLLGVCGHPDCLANAALACGKVLACGHFCGGIQNETECLPCFSCSAQDSRQDADDLCVICFVDRLGVAPCVKLSCGHFFHFACVKMVLEKRWAGPRILFRFMHCPLCKAQIEHSAFEDLLRPLRVLLQDVSDKARLRLEYDGLLNVPAITADTGEFYQDATGFALQRYMYVLCSKCGKAYFGGESSCQEALEHSTSYNPEELVCGACSDITGAEVCGRHGVDFLEYKCRFCCSVAVYFCFASTHFCAGCHADFQRLMPLAKTQLPQCPVGPKCVQLEGDECPLRVSHPPTGQEFSLGCGICRNLRTF